MRMAKRERATKIMTGLQSYVHFRYGNYNKNTTLIKNNFINSLAVDADLIGLENRLNKYFIKNGNNMMGEVPEEVLERFNQVIQEKFSAADLGKINLETLGNQNSKYAKERGEALKRQVKLGQQSFYRKTAEKAIANMKQRIQYLTNSDTKEYAEQQLNSIQQEFQLLSNQMGNENRWYRSALDFRVASFAQSIEELQKILAGGSSTIHGSYAEYVVALMSAVAENKAKNGVNDILINFEKNLQNIGGQHTSAAFSIDNSHFFGKANVSEIIGNRHQIYDKNSGIVYTANTTQDKVDVNIQFNGVSLPASIKNLNLANTKFKDIHLLSGVGILALLNQEAQFVNHWLNLSPVRVGGPQMTQKNAPSGVKEAEDKNMKFLMAYRALAGGRTTKEGTNSLAKIFIVNDNSTGRFKVFGMNTILKNIQNNLDLLNIKTTPDLFSMKNIWEGRGLGYGSENAYRRVTKMLAQLNATKLYVSIDNSIIKNAF